MVIDIISKFSKINEILLYIGVADVPSMVKKLKAKAWIIASTKEETSLCSAVSELGLTGTCFEVCFAF